MPWAEYRYVWYAEKYGWTPDQVDNVPLKLDMWYKPISAVIAHERSRREQLAYERAKNAA